MNRLNGRFGDIYSNNTKYSNTQAGGEGCNGGCNGGCGKKRRNGKDKIREEITSFL